jgi:hypothetical protein
MEQQPENDPIEALEVPPTDFKAQIEEIYHELPQSIKTEYQARLRKHGHANDFETQQSYDILMRLKGAYDRKRERSRRNSQLKRDSMKALQVKLNLEPKPRGRPKKVVPIVAEPKSPPPPVPEELPEPEEPELEPPLNDEEIPDEPEEAFEMDELNVLMQDLKMPEKIPPKKEVPLPPPPPLVRHSLSTLFI